jgi:hypothetical protein
MKKRIVLALILSLVFVVSAPAQTKVRVRFAKGASSATLKGRVAGYKYIDYILGASAGQTMSVILDSASPNLEFVIFDKNMENLDGATGALDWSGELPSSGNYTIRVLFPRADARRGASGNFTLMIEIRK